MSIAANKVKGIRCAHVTNALEAKLSKMHNNANVMALGAKNPDALEMVKIFLETSFSNEERHVRRCEEIIKIENGDIEILKSNENYIKYLCAKKHIQILRKYFAENFLIKYNFQYYIID